MNDLYITDVNYINHLDDYIGTYLDSRLGNLLFEIAAGITAAQEYNKRYIAFINKQSDQYDYIKPFSKNIFKKIDIIDSLPPNYIIARDDPEFNIYRKLPYKKNIIYKGYFQSEKYFMHNKKYIFNLFSPSDYILSTINNLYGDISDFISIHVRRGDYVNDMPRFDTLKIEYYNKCINYFGTDKKYIIVSDDIEWCKQNIKSANIVYADKKQYNLSNSDYILIDLYIQSLCEHNIISNSTFSWWGAWLNSNINKKVVIPYPWFAKNYFLNKYAEDLYPNTWTRINKE